ncbi:excalibur calcium-binding domain-containing protein [Chryseobacterium sp. ISL-80]|nr:excalibur calcium-binding domain-containing protein [Chryseobacterium sp. ISL-80]
MGVNELKKYLVGLLALFLIFSLVACSSESPETSKAEDRNEEKGSEEKAKAEAEAKAKVEAEAKAKAEAEAKAKAEAEAQAAAASSGETEDFANCTELRKKYPNGVPSDHPAYKPKMDRDKDNFACER